MTLNFQLLVVGTGLALVLDLAGGSPGVRFATLGDLRVIQSGLGASGAVMLGDYVYGGGAVVEDSGKSSCLLLRQGLQFPWVDGFAVAAMPMSCDIGDFLQIGWSIYGIYRSGG